MVKSAAERQRAYRARKLRQDMLRLKTLRFIALTVDQASWASPGGALLRIRDLVEEWRRVERQG